MLARTLLARTVEVEADLGHPEQAPTPGVGVRRSSAAPLEERDRELCEERLLPFALVRLGCAVASPGREIADHDPVTRYTASANQLALLEDVCAGGRKKKLNASMLATATPIAMRGPRRPRPGGPRTGTGAEAENRDRLAKQEDRRRDQSSIGAAEECPRRPAQPGRAGIATGEPLMIKACRESFSSRRITRRS